MIKKIKENIFVSEFIPVFLLDYSKYKITDHGEGNGKDHITYVVQEEYSQYAVYYKMQLNSRIQSFQINKAGKEGIEYKIKEMSHFMLLHVIQYK